MKRLFRRTDDTGIIFRDVMSLLMVSFIILFILALVHINPDAESDDSPVVPPGSLLVNVFWPDGLNVDVDTWVQGPGDRTPVGYSNRAGRVFNLLRDDLGTVNDETPLNFENAYSRGAPPGDYTINVHMFANKDNPPTWPIPVQVIVSIAGEENGKAKASEIYSGTVMLTQQNEEITAVRFEVDEDEQVIPNSINTIQKYLRTRQ